MSLAEVLVPSIAQVGGVKIGTLGAERKSQKGATWRPPVKLDHFIITTLQRHESGPEKGLLVRDTALEESLAPHRDADGKLRSLPILFPSNDPEEIMQSTHVWYAGKKLAAKREGGKATFFYDPTNGQQLAEPRVVKWQDSFLDEPDPLVRNKRLFRLHTNLNLMIASPMARWGGFYRFRSNGEISARQLYGSLLWLRRLAGGVLRGPVFRLVVRPMLVSPEGKTTTVHVVHVEYVGSELAQLRQAARDQSAFELENVQVQAEADRQYKALAAKSIEADLDDEDVPTDTWEPNKPAAVTGGGPATPTDPPADESDPNEPDNSEQQAATLARSEKEIADAPDVATLAAAWAQMKVAKDRHEITYDQYTALGVIKDARKAALIATAPTVPPVPPAPPAAAPTPEAATAPAAAPVTPTAPATEPAPAGKAKAGASIIADLEKLMGDLGESWQDVRAEHAEVLGIEVGRIKDITPDQALALRSILKTRAKQRVPAGAA